MLPCEQQGCEDTPALQMMPLTLGCSPGLAGSPTGEQKHWTRSPRCSQQGSDGHPGRVWLQHGQILGTRGSVPRSLGGEGRLRGCFTLPRADVVGPTRRWEAAGRFGLTTGAKLGWPREGESQREGMCD